MLGRDLPTTVEQFCWQENGVRTQDGRKGKIVPRHSIVFETQCTVHIYLEYHSECPIVGIGTFPPSPASECAPQPRTKEGGGHTLLRVRDCMGESQFHLLEKKPSTLSTLWWEESNRPISSLLEGGGGGGRKGVPPRNEVLHPALTG